VKLSKREIVLLGLLILVGVFYLGYNYVLEPLNIKTNQLRDENNKLSTDLQALEQTMSKQGDIRLEEQKIREVYTEILAKVPSSPMVPHTIDFMELRARESKVKLQSIKYRENAATKPAVNNKDSQPVTPAIQTAEFNIIASGSHFNLLNFLMQIENAPRIYISNESKIYLAKNDKLQSISVADTSQQEMGSTETGIITELEEKGSQAYDKNKSEINIEFTAYYDGSSTTIQNITLDNAPVTDSDKIIQTGNITSPAPDLEKNEKKAPKIKVGKAFSIIDNLSVTSAGLKERISILADDPGRFINRGWKIVEEQFKKLPEYRRSISAGTVKAYKITLETVRQSRMDANIITFLPENNGVDLVKEMHYSGF
jgi:Tfp pilus assembly protein PilO